MGITVCLWLGLVLGADDGGGPSALKEQPRAAVADWPAIVQQPYEKLPRAELGLKPLLQAGGEKITTAAAWEAERRRLQDAWLARLGSWPARPRSLDARVESQEEQPDHLRRLVSFASEGDDRIRAYLLLPRDMQEGEQRPAVVVLHQTTKETLREPVGLAGDGQLAFALELTRRGYVTLSPECFIMKDGGPRLQAERLAQRRPQWTGLGKMAFDASRAVDYLESVPQVDAKRIGCIGHSLGAKEVLFAMALEPRYRAGVFSEGGLGLRMSNWTDAWYLGEKMKPHIPALENHQVLALIAPRPVMIVAGDSADRDASWTLVAEARELYSLLGARERIGFHNHRAGHALPKQARQLAYQWLDHWLSFKPH